MCDIDVVVDVGTLQAVDIVLLLAASVNFFKSLLHLECTGKYKVLNIVIECNFSHVFVNLWSSSVCRYVCLNCNIFEA